MVPLTGSFEVTVMVFVIGPLNLLVSTVATTLPLSPGLAEREKSATVQPHDGFASLISRSLLPVFLKLNVNWAFSPLTTSPRSIWSFSNSIFGALAGAAGLAASAGLA